MTLSGADDSDLWGGSGLRPIRSPERGFSLLELILVLALVATLSSGIAVIGRGGSKGVLADVGVSVLSEVLAEARALALSRGVNVRLIFPAGSGHEFQTFWLTAANATGGWDAVGGVRSLPPEVFVRIVGGPSVGAGDSVVTSIFSGGARFAVQGVLSAEAADWNYIEFRPAGTAIPGLLVIDQVGPDGWAAGSRDEGLRGLRVSVYGTVTVLPGVECF